MENQNRVAKIVLLVAGFVLVLCLGMAVGGAAIYGVLRLTDRQTADVAPSFDFSFEEEPSVEVVTAGARIVEVIAGGPAEEAGLQVGDTILAVDGQQVGVDDDLAGLIAAHDPGDRVRLQVQRADGESEDLWVELGENPDDEEVAYLGVRYSTAPMQFRGQGMMPFRLPEGTLPEDLPLPPGRQMSGVVVMAVADDGPAAAAGLESGDVITALDGEALENPRALTAALAEREPGDRVTLTVYSPLGGGQREVEVRLAEHPDRDGQAYLGVTLGGAFRFYRFGSQGEGGELRGFGHREGFFALPESLQEWLPFESPSNRQDVWPDFRFDFPPAGEDCPGGPGCQEDSL